MLDHLLAELKKRFSPHQKLALEGLHLVPSVLVTKDLPTVTVIYVRIDTIGNSTQV